MGDDREWMTAPDAAPYETLARMLERELELLCERRFAELGELRAARTRLLATLPPVAPACARPALERAWVMHCRSQDEILRRREALVVDLAKIRRARLAARGYAQTRQTAPRISASA